MSEKRLPAKNILITGGCGFIGTNFIRFLLAGPSQCRIINLDKLTYAGNQRNLESIAANPQYRFVQGDIRDYALLEEIFADEEIGTVIHFAAESHVDRSIYGPADFISTNVTGTLTLLEAARKVWLSSPGAERETFRFLHVSTDEVYGSLGETGAFSEETPYDPRSPYSASKAGSDHLVSAYFHTYGIPTLITNCSNNYGPYQFPEKLIPLVITNGLAGKELPVYGDGNNVRDWLHVEDHCRAILAVLEKGTPGETYNIGANNEKRNIEVVEAICDLLDEKSGLLDGNRRRRSLITFVNDRPGHDRRYAINAAKIKKQLGWRPAISFARGLEQTVDWYLANQDWLQSVLDGSYRQYYKKMYEGR